MTDIVIYTNDKVLNHKRGKDGHEWYYWKFNRMPKDIKPGDRVFFATKKKIRGSFKVAKVDRTNHEIEWNTNSWNPLKKLKQINPFRGFRYRRE